MNGLHITIGTDRTKVPLVLVTANGSPPSLDCIAKRSSTFAKQKSQSWSLEALISAIASVEAGAKICIAARFYNIPPTSL